MKSRKFLMEARKDFDIWVFPVTAKNVEDAVAKTKKKDRECSVVCLGPCRTPMYHTHTERRKNFALKRVNTLNQFGF